MFETNVLTLTREWWAHELAAKTTEVVKAPSRPRLILPVSVNHGG